MYFFFFTELVQKYISKIFTQGQPTRRPRLRMNVAGCESSPPVVQLTSVEEIEAHAAKHAKLIVKFTAGWCGPCKSIEPRAKAIAQEFGFEYSHVDVDVSADALDKYDISGMPTFVFFIKGQLAECRVVGADVAGLRTACASFQS